MPRKRQIITDPIVVLRSLHRETSQRRLRRKLDDATGRSASIEHDHEGNSDWIPYSLELFTGQDELSESERTRWRQELLWLEEHGLIEVAGVRASKVRLTDDGEKVTTSLLADQATTN